MIGKDGDHRSAFGITFVHFVLLWDASAPLRRAPMIVAMREIVMRMGHRVRATEYIPEKPLGYHQWRSVTRTPVHLSAACRHLASRLHADYMLHVIVHQANGISGPEHAIDGHGERAIRRLRT